MKSCRIQWSIPRAWYQATPGIGSTMSMDLGCGTGRTINWTRICCTTIDYNIYFQMLKHQCTWIGIDFQHPSDVGVSSCSHFLVEVWDPKKTTDWWGHFVFHIPSMPGWSKWHEFIRDLPENLNTENKEADHETVRSESGTRSQHNLVEMHTIISWRVNLEARGTFIKIDKPTSKGSVQAATKACAGCQSGAALVIC